MLHSTWRGFFMAKQGQTFHKYTEEWKKSAIQMYLQGEMSYRTIAKLLGMPDATPIKRWVKKYRNGEDLTDKRGKTTGESRPFIGRPRTKFASIEEERDYLKAQVEYLKKRFQNLYGEGDSQK